MPKQLCPIHLSPDDDRVITAVQDLDEYYQIYEDCQYPLDHIRAALWTWLDASLEEMLEDAVDILTTPHLANDHARHYLRALERRP